MMHFPINLCGVEDSVENYQSYLYHAVRLWCSNPMKSFFYVLSFVSRSISRFSCLNMLSLTFYSLGILLLAVEMSDRKAFRSQARQIAATDPISDLCCCTCYF